MLLAQSPAMAAANCESIKDVFAYNECLAKSAPPVAARPKGGTGAENPEATVRGRSGDQGAENGVRITRQSKRVSAVIDPWAGARAPVGQKKRRR
jgi:hypothetical protein